MSVTVGHIIEWMEVWAPKAFAEGWDNPGLAVGSPNQEITKVLVALDATPEVIQEAVDVGADMVVTHHPLIFGSISSVAEDTPLGKSLCTLIRHGIAAFSAHTNLDRARGGTNDTLATGLGLENIVQLGEEKEGLGMGRMGCLPCGIALAGLTDKVKEVLGLETLVFCGNPEQRVEKVAVCTGAGFSIAADAVAAGAQVLVTGDLKYHDACHALELGLAVIDGTHFGTETIVTEKIAAYLAACAAQEGKTLEVLCAKVSAQPLQWS